MRALAAILIVLAAPCAEARVRLTTLPARERVAVRFEDTGEVLVEEARVLTLDKGLNQVDFTWLGVNINRSSVQLLPAAGKGPTVLRTTYPPSEPTSLVWEVASPQAGPVAVRIAYLLQGLSRTTSWRAVVAEPAKGRAPRLALRLQQHLANDSGEDFDEASLRAAYGDPRVADLASGEAREQLVARFASVPYEKRYTFAPDRRGGEVAVDYVLANTVDGGLGKGLLPGGKVRIFQQTGETEAFVGEDRASPTALGEELVLHVGTARDVVVRRALMSSRQDVQQRDRWNNPSLWTDVQQWRWELENFTDETRTVRIVQPVQGEWDVADPTQVLESRIAPEKFELAKGEQCPAGRLERDPDGLVAWIPVPPNRRVVFTAEVRRGNLH